MANAWQLIPALLSALLLGLGTSLAYPTLIAHVADKASPDQRASALGLYRFFRDSGYIVGASLASLEALGLSTTLTLTGTLFLGVIFISHWKFLLNLKS